MKVEGGFSSFDNAFIGAIEVTRNYPLHLVVLHTMTAIALWISLSVLVFASGVLAKDATEVVKLDFRQRMKDFFVLSKPSIPRPLTTIRLLHFFRPVPR